MDAPRPPQAGYGLPCAKCHRYFPADLEICPYCKTQERVSPVVAPRVLTLPKVQDPIEPVPATVALGQEREELLEQLRIKSPLFVPQSKMGNSPVAGDPDRRPAAEESVAIPLSPKVQDPIENLPGTVSLEQEREELLEQFKSPLFVAKAEMGKLSDPGNMGEHHPGGNESRLTGVPDTLPPVKRAEERDDAEWETRADESAAVRSEVAHQNGRRHLDRVTVILGVVVLAFAVLLITLVGFRFGRHRTTADYVHDASSTTSTASGTQQQNVSSSNAGASSLPIGAPESSASTATPSGVVAPPADPLANSGNGKESLRTPPAAHDEKQHAKVEHSSPVGPARVFTLSPDAAEDALLHRVEPVYPEEARQQGIQGSVVLDLHIGKDGAVQRVDLISGPALLAEASTAAVKQWQFKPHSVGGNQVEMQTRTTLSFTLPTL
jgi:protein TonB